MIEAFLFRHAGSLLGAVLYSQPESQGPLIWLVCSLTVTAVSGFALMIAMSNMRADAETARIHALIAALKAPATRSLATKDP